MASSFSFIFVRAFFCKSLIFATMFIWILAVVLLALFALIGFFNGAICMCVSFLGAFVALLMAKPLAPLAKPLVSLVGVKNPLWISLLPPVFVVVILALVFFGVAFAVHRPVALFYKYKADDLT